MFPWSSTDFAADMASFNNAVKVDAYVSRYFEPEWTLTHLAEDLQHSPVAEMNIYLRRAVHDVTPEGEDVWLGYEMLQFGLTRKGDAWTRYIGC